MRGFPKFFNTKEDYLNTLSLYPEQTKSALRQLYNDRFIWKCVRELDEGEEFTPAKDLMLQEEGEGSSKKRVVYQYVEDDNARYLQLGFSKEEVEELIS